MSLLNYTLKYLSIALLGVITIWALLFYLNMIGEVRDSLDDGLENNKMLVIQRVAKDTSVIAASGFSEHNYYIREISERKGISFKEYYQDTLMYTLNDRAYEPFRMLTTVFDQDGRYYQMKVVASAVEEGNLLRHMLYSIIWLYAAILISVLLINNFLLRKAWRPFYQLLSRLKAFRLDKDHHIQTPKTPVREFNELNAVVAELISHSVGTYNNQKQFIENAAHELQTPLAISMNRLELLAETEGLSEDQLNTIGRVIDSLQRFSRLNKSLLLLSKIENKQYGETAVISLSSLIKTVMDDLEDFVDLKSIRVQFNVHADIKVNMNRDLALILLSNLYKNAITHNHTGGSIRIDMDRNVLSVSNTGNAQALDAKRIFKRFQKESKQKSSTGLGLAIVKAIADVYGFSIVYSYETEHTFTIRFQP